MRVTQYPASASSTSNQPFCSRLAFTPHMCGHPSPCMHPSPPPHEWTLEMYVRTRTRTSRSKGRTYLTSSKSSASRRRPAAARQAAAAICGGNGRQRVEGQTCTGTPANPGSEICNLPLPRSEKYVSLFVPGFLRKFLFVFGGRRSASEYSTVAVKNGDEVDALGSDGAGDRGSVRAADPPHRGIPGTPTGGRGQADSAGPVARRDRAACSAGFARRATRLARHPIAGHVRGSDRIVGHRGQLLGAADDHTATRLFPVSPKCPPRALPANERRDRALLLCDRLHCADRRRACRYAGSIS